jgi:hypothetical protein
VNFEDVRSVGCEFAERRTAGRLPTADNLRLVACWARRLFPSLPSTRKSDGVRPRTRFQPIPLPGRSGDGDSCELRLAACGVRSIQRGKVGVRYTPLGAANGPHRVAQFLCSTSPVLRGTVCKEKASRRGVI